MKAKKSLGQNFLKDEKILNDIFHSFDATKDDLIIEIGPGKGALTKRIKDKHSRIIAYEIDTDLIPFLNKINADNLIIKNQDFLLSDLKNDIKSIKNDKLFIIGNLPYYITTPIIKYIIDSGLFVDEMLFMVQEEVANRFSAKPGAKDYGSMTLYLNYFFKVEKLFKVSKKCFDPEPKVESAIIKLTRRDRTFKVDESKYFKLIDDAFTQKRKTLKNNLKDYDWNKIVEILKKHNLNELVRAEELDEEIFIEICNL